MKKTGSGWAVVLTIAMACSVFTFMPASAFGAEDSDQWQVENDQLSVPSAQELEEDYLPRQVWRSQGGRTAER